MVPATTSAVLSAEIDRVISRALRNDRVINVHVSAQSIHDRLRDHDVSLDDIVAALIKQASRAAVVMEFNDRAADPSEPVKPPKISATG